LMQGTAGANWLSGWLPQRQECIVSIFAKPIGRKTPGMVEKETSVAGRTAGCQGGVLSRLHVPQ
jgi:hypothetical protein